MHELKNYLKENGNKGPEDQLTQKCVSSHHTFSAELPHGQRRKENSISYKIYVKQSKGTEKASCSEEVQPFQIGRSEGGFSHGPLEIRCRVIGAYGFSLFRLLPFLPVRFQLSAGSQLLRNGMPNET